MDHRHIFYKKFRLTATIPYDIIISQGHLTMSQQNQIAFSGAKTFDVFPE